MMASTLKNIVSRLSPKAFGPKEEMIYVAAFGKHPGWDDHIEDIGLGTETLVAFKRKLYLEGISSNIDSGRWVKSAEANQAIEFGHTFVGIGDKTVIVGRLWASADGKGRSIYPMVVCIQCSAIGLDWILNNLPACLEDIEKACRTAESSGQVVAIIEKAQADLRAIVQGIPAVEDIKKSLIIEPNPLPNIAEFSEFQAKHSLPRILYFLEREVDRYQNPINAKMLRVPSVPGASEKRIRLWVSYLVSKYGLTIPMLFLIPNQHPWIDVILGSPTPAQFCCLRVSQEAIPLTSHIPYNIEPECLKKYTVMLNKKTTH